MTNEHAKTQKAKGILNGLDYLFGGGYYCNAPSKYKGLNKILRLTYHKLIHSDYGLLNYYHSFPMFARPCPMKPRHGFVDSRVVKSKTELASLWKEVKKCDPKGEIICGPYFKNVAANAVYVSSGSIAVGRGNDGATGGKSSISFPVAPHKFDKKLYKASGLDKNDAVYLESVSVPRDDKTGIYNYLVQIRGGPHVSSGSPDYVPKAMKVKSVVTPHDDLLKWEKEVSKFGPGTVVYGAGHTLSSHAAVHCILNKVPFVTTYRPEVGDKIKPTKQAIQRKLRRNQFKRGCRAAINMSRERAGSTHTMLQYFYFTLSVLHNWAYLRQSEHADWLLGAATTLFAKNCAALAFGEFRHSHRAKAKFPKIYKHGRDAVYKIAMNGGVSIFNNLPTIYEDFHGAYWEAGFGGPPWATCTWYTHSLWSRIVRVFNRKDTYLTDKEIGDLMTYVNKTVNVAHNGGWWFNKISDKSDMDLAANVPGLVAYCAAEIYGSLYERVQKVKLTTQRFKSPGKLSQPFVKTPDGCIGWVYAECMCDSNIAIWLALENGKYKHAKIKLNKQQLKRARTYCRSHNIDRYPQIKLEPRKYGKAFMIPGVGIKDVGKVFKLKCNG